MDSCKTKKNRVNSVNKKELWSIYDAEINESQDIKCIYNNDNDSSLCKLCNYTLAQTDEGYYSCTNNKCGELYNNIFDFGCEVKTDTNDNQRYGMPINPYLQESSFGCKVNCNNISSYEMRKIKRYTEWQSMPYKEKSQYDEFQRIINMSQKWKYI